MTVYRVKTLEGKIVNDYESMTEARWVCIKYGLNPQEIEIIDLEEKDDSQRRQCHEARVQNRTR